MSAANERLMLSIAKGPIARGTVRTSAVLGLRLLVQAGTLLLVAWLLGPRTCGYRSCAYVYKVQVHA